MTTALTKTLRRRSAKRKTIATSLYIDIDDVLNRDVSEDTKLSEATALLNSLIETQKQVRNYDETVLDLTENQNDLDAEVLDAHKFDVDVRKKEEKLRRFIQKQNEDNVTTTSNKSSKKIGVRLPVITIKPFEGQPINWNPFLEQFNASIDSREELSNIEKLTYLKGFLRGDALQAIEGLPLTNANYENAKKILATRYGNPQLIISSHMNNLIQLEKISGADVRKLRSLYDKIEANVRALNSVGIDSEHFGALLIPIIMQKLPNVIKLQLSRQLGTENWGITDFLKCLSTEIAARESYELLKHDDEDSKIKDDEFSRSKGTISSLHISHKSKICVFCEDGSHYSDKCDVVTEIDARRSKLMKSNLCFRCLRKGHLSKDCTKKIYCFKCKMQNNHNTALCMKEQSKSKGSYVTTSGEHVLLQTAQGYAANEKETEEQPVKILLDSGSQQSYITEKIAKKLRLKPLRRVNTNIKTFGSEKSKEMKLQEFSFSLKAMDKKETMYVKALAVPKICDPISDQNISLAIEQHDFLKSLKLADNGNNPNGEIDFLIGADIYWKIVSGTIRKHHETGLAVINSALGWLVNGPVKDNSTSVSVNVVNSHVLKIESQKTDDQLLSDQIHKFWNLDTVGIAENETSVYENFTAKIEFKEGRYNVELPFKENHPALPDNYTLSKKRLESLKKHLDSDEQLKRNYDKVFQEQLENGIIEKVEKPGVAGETTYLPHRAVIKEDRSSTKVRIVFDGSAKRGNNVSLNEILYKGPSLTPNLFDLLIKFRVYPIAITADIEKAYLQINVIEKHRDCLRFLWYRDVFADEPEIQKYRFKRVIFGATSSQFLLNSTIRKHADKYETVDSEFARKAKKHFYVDDLTTGVNNVQDGIELYKKFKIRFSEASFNTRKWRTNSQELRQKIEVLEDTLPETQGKPENQHEPKRSTDEVGETPVPVEFQAESRASNVLIEEPIEQSKQSNINLSRDEDSSPPSKESTRDHESRKTCQKALGIVWDEHKDTLRLGVGEIFENAEGITPTKRNILRIIASIYDPIGILQPIVIKLKLLFQEVCLLNIDWDNNISSSLEQKWRLIIETLKNYSDLCIRRCYTIPDVNDPIEKRILHGFSDASEKAYGACIYLKTISRCGFVNVSLVTAKSRVAPVKKKYSIPRLELLGNFVLAKLIDVVYQTLNEEVNIDKLFCWTDSMITLSWIKALDQEFETFVQNRVTFIREKVNYRLWKYVPTSENPADLITRFDSIDVNGSTNSLWLDGPKFLVKEEVNEVSSKFNEEEASKKEDTFDQTMKDVFTMSILAKTKENSKEEQRGMHTVIDIGVTNNYTYLMKVTAWLLRFIENCRSPAESRVLNNHLTSSEILKAERLWIQSNQQKLRNHPNYEVIRNSLNLKTDAKGIIRSRGRIEHANVPYDTKEPIMLERNDKLTELIVWQCHDTVKHEGVRETLTEFQSTYWVTQSKSLVKKILFRCRLCRYLNSRSYSYPRSPSLPKARLRDDNAYTATGVDHMGPLYTKNIFDYDSIEEDDMYKCYVTLYTCASTRGILLDLVPDTSAKHFIYSLRRFIARRGCPNEMLSDNGTAFSAKETQIFAAEKRIKWHFSIAEAPWFGGFWERLVQLTKRCLKKVVGNAHLNFLELQTILLEIETVLNSRPLCELYDDDYEEPLTPNHLLFGRKLSFISSGESHNEKSAPERKRVRYIEKLCDHYWNRWRKEYCVALRNHQRKYRKKNDLCPSVNDVVIIYEEKVPRQNWRLGRIVSLLPSKDGNIRGARVLIGKSKRVIERPINKLYPIEFANDANNPALNDKIDTIDASKNSISDQETGLLRSKRNAAIIGDIKRKFAY